MLSRVPHWQIPPFKRADKTLTVDLSSKDLLVRSNAFVEFFDYDRGTADEKVPVRVCTLHCAAPDLLQQMLCWCAWDGGSLCPLGCCVSIMQLCHVWFHTAFVDRGYLCFNKEWIDVAHKVVVGSVVSLQVVSLIAAAHT